MTSDPNFPDRDKYFPNNKDGDGIKWIRLYKVVHEPNGTFGSKCTWTDPATGILQDFTQENHLDWKNGGDPRLDELVDDIVADWQSVVKDIKFVKAEQDQPAHINFKRTKGSFVGTIGSNPCSGWFTIVNDGFPAICCGSDEDGIPRSERYRYTKDVVVGSSIVGGFGKATMGIFSHEFGHIMELGHVGDVMHFANTTGETILTGKNSINTVLDIHGGKDLELVGLFPGNETLEQYKARRLAVREKHYDAAKIASKEAKDFFDFRVWPESRLPKRWTWQVNDFPQREIGRFGLMKKLARWSLKSKKIRNLNVTRIQ